MTRSGAQTPDSVLADGGHGLLHGKPAMGPQDFSARGPIRHKQPALSERPDDAAAAARPEQSCGLERSGKLSALARPASP